MSIAATIGAVTSLVNVIKSTSDKKEIKDFVDGFNKINKSTVLLKTNGSITKLLSNFIVSPIAVVDNTLRNEEIIDKVIELNTNIFSGYFAQAFDILIKVYGLDHKTALNLLSTDKVSLGLEELDYVGQLLDDGSEILNISIEDKKTYKRQRKDRKKDYEKQRKDKLDDYEKQRDDNRKDKNNEVVTGYLNKHNANFVDDDKVSNIIENRLDIEVVLSTNGIKHIIVIPMIVKTSVLYVSPKHIVEAVESKGDDKRFGARLDEYRAGAISLGDLVLGNDLIKEYKNGQIKDNNQLLEVINKRTLNANAKAVTDLGVGFEKYFNLLIISNYTKSMIESAVKGSINKAKYKEKVLESTASLLCTVVDTDYERVIIYTKDIDGVSDITFKSLSKGKGKSDDLSDILKSLLNNTPPSF